jgi:C-terminal region of band_7
VAEATAESLLKITEAIQVPGGYQAVQLRLAEQYLARFGNLAKAGNTLVVPASLSDAGSMITMAMNIIRQGPGFDRPSAAPSPQPHVSGKASGLAEVGSS